MSKSIERRVANLERAVASGLGVDLDRYDPEVVEAKAKAAEAAAREVLNAEQAVRDEAEARATAQREAEAKAEAELAARAQAILESKAGV